MLLHQPNREDRLSRSKYRRQKGSNRGAKIITAVFSIVIVLSFILSLVGPQTFRGSADPTPFPTRIIATAVPIASSTPTAEVPTPLAVTPTPSQ
jgi:hypothetical protein